MKPYGKSNPCHNKIDFHPGKGYINWWEKELSSISKKRVRRLARIEIEKEINDVYKGRSS
jgi:hypothetical protein